MKVGFVNMFAGDEWLGGLNYVRNLLWAVTSLEGRAIEPVLVAGRRANPAVVDGFSCVPLVRSPALDRYRPTWVARKILRHCSLRDFVLERVLIDQGISVLSHSGHLGPDASIPCVGWIPDFQHRHLPDIFSAAERRQRDRSVQGLAEFCSKIVVSSEAAARDLQMFAPKAKEKVRVLRFASGLTQGESLPSRSELETRYGLPARYIHVPNQFWFHKNHMLLVQALRILKERGRPAVIVATGRIEDSRQPHYVQALMDSVHEFGLDDGFRPLGVVPYRDMLGLMRSAIAVCNPSRFEGWSTSVEEAKSLGKTVLVSDIPVHREQNPDRALFFAPDSAEEAAHAIWQVWSSFEPRTDEQAIEEAAARLPTRMRAFALSYQSIIMEAAGLEQL